MGRWISVDALIHDHPKMEKVGPWGLVVVQAAWRLCKAHSFPGEIPDDFWTVERIMKWTLFGEDYREQIASGMLACVDHGLAEPATTKGHAVVKLHNWQMYQRDDTAAERMKRYRERKKGDDNEETVTDVTRNVTDVTIVTDVTRQDMTGRDVTIHKEGSESPEGYNLTPNGAPAPPRKREAKKKKTDPLRKILLDVCENVWTEKNKTTPSFPKNALGFMGGPAEWLRQNKPDITNEERGEALRDALKSRKTFPKIQFLSSDIAEIMADEESRSKTSISTADDRVAETKANLARILGPSR